jgi:hypothetical protein
MLRPGSELHIADVGRHHDALMHMVLAAIWLVKGLHRIKDNVDGRLPEFQLDASFIEVAAADPFPTLVERAERR